MRTKERHKQIGHSEETGRGREGEEREVIIERKNLRWGKD